MAGSCCFAGRGTGPAYRGRLYPVAGTTHFLMVPYFEAKGRIEASRNLALALDDAEARIVRQPYAGLPAPRPYPDLRRVGASWITSGRCWIAYKLEGPPLILAVFDATADIPGRFNEAIPSPE